METELLKKYIAGDASQEEKEIVQLWLEADKKNMKEYMAMRTLYDITLANLQETNVKSIIKKPAQYYLREVLKIAAVALIAFGASYTLFLYVWGKKQEDPVMQSLFVPAGQRVELTLADGTVVWLNAQTTFKFPNKFDKNSREVYLLNGEAYFNVAKNKDCKFTVNTPFYDINVLGTEFNVLAYGKTKCFETSLLEGSIELVSKNKEEKLHLVPGQHVAMKDNSLKLEKLPHQDYFLWKEGILCFDDERVEDILNKLSIVYDMDIQNYNKSIVNNTIRCKFHIKEGVEQAMKVLKIKTGLQYKIYEDSNLITIW
ncbi:FecR family protein [Bacteroides sp. 519]|nr:FecR family protein [Bacteroides sp. 519]